MLALDEFNMTPPIIAPYHFENFPSQSLLLLGTVCYSLLSNGILQTRNNLKYSDGGQNIMIWDKGPAYIYNPAYEQFSLPASVHPASSLPAAHLLACASFDSPTSISCRRTP